jgi:hypothetical protein
MKSLLTASDRNPTRNGSKGKSDIVPSNMSGSKVQRMTSILCLSTSLRQVSVMLYRPHSLAGSPLQSGDTTTLSSSIPPFPMGPTEVRD